MRASSSCSVRARQRVEGAERLVEQQQLRAPWPGRARPRRAGACRRRARAAACAAPASRLTRRDAAARRGRGARPADQLRRDRVDGELHVLEHASARAAASSSGRRRRAPGPGPSTGAPSSRIVAARRARSGRRSARPASSCRSPRGRRWRRTRPRATSRLRSRSTAVRAAARRRSSCATPRSSRNAMRAPRVRPSGTARSTTPIRRSSSEADQADGEDRQEDVGVDQAVVLLPEEAADAGRAGQHLGGDDHQPGDAEGQPKAGEHVGQRRRDDDLAQHRPARQPQHAADVQVVLGIAAHADGGVDHRRPHRAERDGEQRRRLRVLEEDQAERQPGQRRDRPQDLDQRVEGAAERRATGRAGSRAACRSAIASAKPLATRTRLSSAKRPMPWFISPSLKNGSQDVELRLLPGPPAATAGRGRRAWLSTVQTSSTERRCRRSGSEITVSSGFASSS